jgi:hypothetical protein
MDGLLRPLCSSIQHIFNEDAVAGGGVIYKNMGDGTNQFSVLNNRRAGRADVIK